MKATFKKIGPIKEAQLELGDLTIIAGQNNTGKTYLVYTLYGVWQSLAYFSYHLLEVDKNHDFIADLNRISRRLKKDSSANIDFSEYKKLEDLILRIIPSVFSSELIADVFSSPSVEFKDAKFQLESVQNSTFIEKGGGYFFYGEKKNASLDFSLNSSHLSFKIKNPENIEIPIELIKRVVCLSLLHVTINGVRPFILSAERFGISLFYKELDLTKNRLVEKLQKLSDKKRFDQLEFLGKQSARYAQPIKDHIDFTRDLHTISKKSSNLMSGKLKYVEKLTDGYYKATGEDIRFISKRRGENRFDIPLHLASSSARGISDLYFYLKHEASLGQTLIIDEPESHLSPTNQILMARLLVFCVNSGLRVLITTHSDYLVKEINNLIMLHGEFKGKDAFLKRKKRDYTEDDHLDPNRVKAYICERGGLTKCNIDNKGIDMPIFDDAIEAINKTSDDLFWLITTEASSND